MGVIPRIPDGMYLLGVRVRYVRVGCMLRIGGVNITRKPQILILTQSTHHTSVPNIHCRTLEPMSAVPFEALPTPLSLVSSLCYLTCPFSRSPAAPRPSSEKI